MKIHEDISVNFVINNLKNQDASQYFGQDKFVRFMQLAKDNSEIAAAEEYQKVTGASIPESHFATSIAMNLSAD